MERRRDLNKEFLDYCFSQNFVKVKACLALDVDVNTTSDGGYWSSLIIAVCTNSVELLEILLKQGNINTNLVMNHYNRGGIPDRWTALMFASWKGKSLMVERLVRVGELNVMYQDQSGDTAAHKASEGGHSQCVRILANTGRVDWDRGNVMGQTPLHLALQGQHSSTVAVIVKQDIDYIVKTHQGQTLAEVAVEGGDEKCVKILADQKKFDCWNISDKNGDTPIMKALKSQKIGLVKVLVGVARVDLSLRDRLGWSLVFRAINIHQLGEWRGEVRRGTLSIIADLVKKILQRLGRRTTGTSLARIAVEVGEVEDIKLLVQAGNVDWNEAAVNEDPAIMWALKNEKLEIVSILLTVPGVDLQYRDKDNLTLAKIAR